MAMSTSTSLDRLYMQRGYVCAHSWYVHCISCEVTTLQESLIRSILKQSTLAEVTKVCISYCGYSFWIKLLMFCIGCERECSLLCGRLHLYFV